MVRISLQGFVFFVMASAALSCSDSGNGDVAPPRSSGGSSAGGAGGSAANSGGAGVGGGTGGSINVDGGGDGALDPDAACAASETQGEQLKRPVDVIFLLDTSSTMQPAIEQVEANVNQNFASIISASAVDYRVIVVAQHSGGTDGVCISSPLSGTNCNPAPAQPANTSVFFQYDPGTHLGSSTTYSEAIDGYNQPDVHGLAPNGWSAWARDGSLKVFVAINDSTSEDSSPLDHASFDSALLGLAPARFGTAAQREYVFHSIVGLNENNPATKPWQPSDPLQTGTCSGYTGPVAAGLIYQRLSILTGGLRLPLCQFQAFDEVFQVIAQGVVQGALLPCSYVLPVPEPGKTLDPATIVFELTDSAGTKQRFEQVVSAAACKPDAFYVTSSTIELCPDACAKVQATQGGTATILSGCDPSLY